MLLSSVPAEHNPGDKETETNAIHRLNDKKNPSPADKTARFFLWLCINKIPLFPLLVCPLKWIASI